MKKNMNRKGAVVLVLILIIAAVTLIVSLSLGFSSVSENQMRFYQSASSRVFLNMDGCAEEALLRINKNNQYTGETFSLNSTSCVITVSGFGDDRIIDITATNTDYTRKLSIGITLFPSFVVTSWQELST